MAHLELIEGLRDFSLEGKAALVVGAEHSVGRAAAVTLAEAGAQIVMLPRRSPAPTRN